MQVGTDGVLLGSWVIISAKAERILDIGTGSGCILLSILKELNLSRGIGIDISAKAIQTAKVNSKILNLSNHSKFKICDLNKYNIGKYDLIVSNPPYIQTSRLNDLMPDVLDFEPRSALDGGYDGLDFYKRIIPEALNYLKKGGVIALEIGETQAKEVTSLFYGEDKYEGINVTQDYSGYDRVVFAKKKTNG